MSRFSEIKAVTLDVGGTLIQPWPSVGHVYGETAARHGCRVDPAILNRRFAAAWKEMSAFSHTRQQWSDLVDRVFAGLTQPVPSESFFPEIYDAFTQPGAWRVFPDVLPALQQFRSRGLKLAVLSNWDDRLRPLLNHLQLEQYFDTLIISCEAGAAKPSPEIYQAATRALDLPAGNLLHMGDDLKCDLEGPRAAGLNALLLDRSQATGGDVVGSLTEANAIISVDGN